MSEDRFGAFLLWKNDYKKLLKKHGERLKESNLLILVVRGAGAFPEDEGIFRVHLEGVQDRGVLIRYSHIRDLGKALGQE